MNIPMLLDHDLEGQMPFLEAGWRETDWDQYLPLEFIRLRDLNIPNDATDQATWHSVQRAHFLLLTNNRHREDATSLQATIERENTQDSLPVLTVSDKDKLVLPAYRQQAAHKLAQASRPIYTGLIPTRATGLCCHQDKLACATDPAQRETRRCTLCRQLQSCQQHGAQDSTIRPTINQEILRGCPETNV